VPDCEFSFVTLLLVMSLKRRMLNKEELTELLTGEIIWLEKSTNF
jgi:hypothetical protein